MFRLVLTSSNILDKHFVNVMLKSTFFSLSLLSNLQLKSIGKERVKQEGVILNFFFFFLDDHSSFFIQEIF